MSTQLGSKIDILTVELAEARTSLELMTTAKIQAEAAANRYASEAKRNALQADRNAARAEAEGMKVEETLGRRLLSELAATEKVCAFVPNLQCRIHPTTGLSVR